MQTIRIHFEDLTYLDIQVSDSQAEEFHQWLRFASRNDTYSVPGTDREIMRKDIARTEVV